MMLEHKPTNGECKLNELSISADETSPISSDDIAEDQQTLASSSEKTPPKRNTRLSSTRRDVQTPITQHFKPIPKIQKRNAHSSLLSIDMPQKKMKADSVSGCSLTMTSSNQKLGVSGNGKMVSAGMLENMEKPWATSSSTQKLESSSVTSTGSDVASEPESEKAKVNQVENSGREESENAKLSDGDDHHTDDKFVVETTSDEQPKACQDDPKEVEGVKLHELAIDKPRDSKPREVKPRDSKMMHSNGEITKVYSDYLAKIRGPRYNHTQVKGKDTEIISKTSTKPLNDVKRNGNIHNQAHAVDKPKPESSSKIRTETMEVRNSARLNRPELMRDKRFFKGMGNGMGNSYDKTPEEDQRSKNLQFYRNEIESKPNGDTIENIIKKWQGDYDKLEDHHGYIQWLFPIPEQGLNREAQPLLPHEREEMRRDDEIKCRLIKSYKLMLNFYGMQFKNTSMGTIRRSPNYEERFRNLCRYSHNNLRITRILKCVAELGLEHLQVPLLEFLIDEVFVHKTLTACKKSLVDYWLPTLQDDEQKQRLKQIIVKYIHN